MVVGRDHDDGVPAGHLGDRVDGGPVGHLDVEQHQVGPGAGEVAAQLGERAGLADDVEVAFLGERGDEPGAEGGWSSHTMMRIAMAGGPPSPIATHRGVNSMPSAAASGSAGRLTAVMPVVTRDPRARVRAGPQAARPRRRTLPA